MDFDRPFHITPTALDYLLALAPEVQQPIYQGLNRIRSDFEGMTNLSGLEQPGLRIAVVEFVLDEQHHQVEAMLRYGEDDPSIWLDGLRHVIDER